MRTLAWYGLGAVTTYFCLVSLALRWRPRKAVRLVRYEPPAKNSPAVAAYLLERGVGDNPPVVAILNMAAKGCLRIDQGPNDYLLSRVNVSATLEAEEEVIADAIFSRAVPSVRLSALFRLERIAQKCARMPGVIDRTRPSLLSLWLVHSRTDDFALVLSCRPVS